MKVGPSLINVFLSFIFVFNGLSCGSLACYCCYFFIYREKDMRNSILAQVLDQSARARCKCVLRVFVYSVVRDPFGKKVMLL